MRRVDALMAMALPLMVLLSGCSGASAGQDDEGHLAPTGLRIEGLVQDLTFVPIAGANVTIIDLNLTQKSGADGRFAFEDLEERIYTVHATAAGYLPSTLLAQPTGGIVGLDFQMTAIPSLEPRNVTVQYKGTLQCAFEALIISPSCDSLLVYANDKAEENGQGRPAPEPLAKNVTFGFEVEAGWTTLVVDVVFDPEASPGLDGIRITLRGSGDDNEAGNYEQYGRFYGAGPYTARIEPNGQYDEGVRPVPENATLFELEMYPHSHGWHSVCDPVTQQCFLGAGAGIDVEFQVLVTAFYVEAAPEGWTLRET